MSAPLALHGGGEFQSGDEPFLRRILERAAGANAAGPNAAEAKATGARPIHVELVTSAVARHRPEATFAHASAALRRVIGETGAAQIDIGHARVVDAASAGDPEIATRLAMADLVYLPGGDPDAVIGILAGSRALSAIERARECGAVVAGASAGAMAMGASTWTRTGHVAGFGWAGAIVVIPHASEARLLGQRDLV
ncbi:MAG: Type 1 glutamine amidotransferase-like domain-containing protein, partial [Candidatus Limnocylindrales bacterium]